MSETTSIVATPRTVIGKANRRLASSGQIPAVLYGSGRKPMPLAVDRHDFELLMSHHAPGATILKLKVEGESKPVNVMVKELQVSPVKGNILHIDFLAIRMNEKIQATVPIHTFGESPGVKAGGILVIGTHSVTIEALPADLPEMLEVDVSALELDDTLLLGDVVPPPGVTIVDDPETVVCSVHLAKAAEAVVEEAVEEVVEPEVIGEAEVGGAEE